MKQYYFWGVSAVVSLGILVGQPAIAAMDTTHQSNASSSNSTAKIHIKPAQAKKSGIKKLKNPPSKNQKKRAKTHQQHHRTLAATTAPAIATHANGSLAEPALSDPATSALTPPAEAPAKKTEFILSAIPEAIDAMPTVLPAESQDRIVAFQEETKDKTWADQRHERFKQYLQHQAHRMDNWFGEPDPEKPAKASIRVLADTTWNEYDNVEIKPRIRGKIKLPTLEKRFSLVFGDDSLDDELRGNVAITNPNASVEPKKKLDQEATKRENNSIALRFSDWMKTDLFDTDFDVGLRDGASDVYGRVKISRNWTLQDDFTTRAEQIYRYGSGSQNYARTNLEIRHHRPNQPFIADQASVTYADEDKDVGVRWENRLFRQHTFFHDNTFSYGLYTGGHAKDKDFQLNGYGPFVSWRQPFLRDWFFVQSDVNYYNDKDLDRSHYLSTFLRLEAVF